VDDIIVLYHKDNREQCTRLIEDLKKEWEFTDQGPAEWFLGIRIQRDRARRKVYLCHDAYIEKVAKRFGLDGSTRYPTIPIPVEGLSKRTTQASKEEVKRYQEKVGSLLYTAITVRPDVAYAASSLSRFLTNPAPEHEKAVDQALRYLLGTKEVSLQYGSDPSAQGLFIASDASYADEKETRRSSQGWIVSLFGGPVIWKATRQPTVTLSTTEAEVLALSETARETMALKRLFRDIRLVIEGAWNIRCDNLQSIRLVVGERERINTRLRHVDIHNMWLRQEFAKGEFKVTYLATAEMPADGLTKALSRQRFEHFRALLNLGSVELESSTKAFTREHHEV
jgi:hypothetical protein